MQERKIQYYRKGSVAPKQGWLLWKQCALKTLVSTYSSKAGCRPLQTKHGTKQRTKARRHMRNVLAGEHMAMALRGGPASPARQRDALRQSHRWRLILREKQWTEGRIEAKTVFPSPRQCQEEEGRLRHTTTWMLEMWFSSLNTEDKKFFNCELIFCQVLFLLLCK